jgi:hypothetical protein
MLPQEKGIEEGHDGAFGARRQVQSVGHRFQHHGGGRSHRPVTGRAGVGWRAGVGQRAATGAGQRAATGAGQRAGSDRLTGLAVRLRQGRQRAVGPPELGQFMGAGAPRRRAGHRFQPHLGCGHCGDA